MRYRRQILIRIATQFMDITHVIFTYSIADPAIIRVVGVCILMPVSNFTMILTVADEYTNASFRSVDWVVCESERERVSR